MSGVMFQKGKASLNLIEIFLKIDRRGSEDGSVPVKIISCSSEVIGGKSG